MFSSSPSPNSWLFNRTNREHVRRLRALLAETDIPIFIFLGAGFSFGVGRSAEEERGVIKTFEFSEKPDDDKRFPSWTQLVERMKEQLFQHPFLERKKAKLNDFFKKESPLDCAQLFWQYTQGPNYWDFLRRQFGSKPGDEHRLTPAHHELTSLPAKQIFTTNYDELIETAYRAKGINIRVSSSSQEFMDHRTMRVSHHLIKLHGTIAHPDTIVLTRSDYAKSRQERTEMFRYLTDQFEYATFLFVGFSLLDPNINILFDEARYVRGGKNPVSYLVQGKEDPLREAYLSSLGINTIALNNWNQLPSFLKVINPSDDEYKRALIFYGMHP